MEEADSKLLAAAKRLPLAERIEHSNWKVRSAAHEDVKAACESAFSSADPILNESGAPSALISTFSKLITPDLQSCTNYNHFPRNTHAYMLPLAPSIFHKLTLLTNPRRPSLRQERRRYQRQRHGQSARLPVRLALQSRRVTSQQNFIVGMLYNSIQMPQSKTNHGRQSNRGVPPLCRT